MAPKDKNFGVQGRLGGMGGKYGRKAENLTAKELKAAGGAKAAAARKVDISQTRRDTTRGITLGPAGKPLTGKVVLSNGNVAVYKAGKRVIKAAAPSKAKSSNGAGGDSQPSGNKLRAEAMKRATADAAKRKSVGNSSAQVGAAARAKAEADARKRKAAGMPALSYTKPAANADVKSTDLSRAQKLARDNVMRRTNLTSSGTLGSKITAIEQSLIKLKVKAKNTEARKSRTAAEQRQLEADKKRIEQLTNQIRSAK